MKIGVNYPELFKRTYGEKGGLTMLREIGFDAVDYSLAESYKNPSQIFLGDEDALYEYYRDVKAHMDKIGIIASQTHAVFPINDAEDGSMSERMFEILRRTIKVTAILGAPYVVIHPATFGVLTNEYERGREITRVAYERLLPTLEECNVKLGVENMFYYDYGHYYYCSTSCTSARDMIDHIEMMNSDRFCACLDLGHAAVVGLKAESMIRQLGSRIELVHAHDNTGNFDCHTFPGEGIANWKEIFKALKDVDFKGVFSMELSIASRLAKLDPALIEDAMKIAYKSAKALVEKYWN